MKALVLAASALLFSSISNAAAVNCTGQIFGYDLTLQTSTDKGTINSDIIIQVKSGSSVLKTIDMKVTSQDIKPGVSIDVSGTSSDGNGTFHGTYNASNDTYVGQMNAQTALGNLQADLVCTSTGTLSTTGELF